MGIACCWPAPQQEMTQNPNATNNFIKKLSQDRFLISFLETPKKFFPLTYLLAFATGERGFP